MHGVGLTTQANNGDPRVGEVPHSQADIGKADVPLPYDPPHSIADAQRVINCAAGIVNAARVVSGKK